MGKPTVLGGSVPVFDFRRNINNVAGFERAGGLTPLPVPAAAVGYKKNGYVKLVVAVC